MYNTKYQHQRPFLCIDKILFPRNGVKTGKPWGKLQDNWDNREIPYVVNRITDKIAARAMVIIDLLDNKLVKNRHAETDNASLATVIGYYRMKYAAQVQQAVDNQTLRRQVKEAL